MLKFAECPAKLELPRPMGRGVSDGYQKYRGSLSMRKVGIPWESFRIERKEWCEAWNVFIRRWFIRYIPNLSAIPMGMGLGDLNGVTEKLDYLKELGVDEIWLTPFFCSPQRDNGYDVADYESVDPMFGTMEDFDRLVTEADKRGMGIMLDMVFNHTSTAHRWFQKALQGDPEYMNYYIFRDAPAHTPPTNWVSKFGAVLGNMCPP